MDRDVIYGVGSKLSAEFMAKYPGRSVVVDIEPEPDRDGMHVIHVELHWRVTPAELEALRSQSGT